LHASSTINTARVRFQFLELSQHVDGELAPRG
jgi:hypothetical protein